MLQAQGHSLQAHTHGAYDTGHIHKYTDTYAGYRRSGGNLLENVLDLFKKKRKVVLEYLFPNSPPLPSEFLGPVGKSNIKVTGVSGAITSSETRPKNMFS